MIVCLIYKTNLTIIGIMPENFRPGLSNGETRKKKQNDTEYFFHNNDKKGGRNVGFYLMPEFSVYHRMANY